MHLTPELLSESLAGSCPGASVLGEDGSSRTESNNWILNQRCHQTTASTPDTATAVATSGTEKHCWCQQMCFSKWSWEMRETEFTQVSSSASYYSLIKTLFYLNQYVIKK